MDKATREIIGHLACGRSIPEAAEMVGIGTNEARRLVDAAMRGAGASSRLELILWAIRTGEVRV